LRIQRVGNNEVELVVIRLTVARHNAGIPTRLLRTMTTPFLRASMRAGSTSPPI
jgi:hypothetical protein